MSEKIDIWQITGIREGDTWDETDELVGAVYEMLPESCSYKSKTWSYTVELGGYEASPIVRWFEYNIGNMLPTPAGYYLSFGEVKPGEEYARSRSAFSPCILTDEKEMLAFWGRRVYRMEKVVDYDDIVEGKDFFRADYGLWSGEWVVTEVLKSEQHIFNIYRTVIRFQKQAAIRHYIHRLTGVMHSERKIESFL